jgi:putative sterol carrier protein
MVAFFSKEFFEEMAKHLNSNPAFTSTIKDFNASMLLTCVDRVVSYKITARNGTVEVAESREDEPADFHFAAPYDVWVSIAKGDVKIQGAVVGGRVKFIGSMPKMLLYLGKLTGMERLMTKLISEIVTEF